ncbi:MAG: hypothetical protein QNJ97_12300 [Myxococcota bacterium]|nr:hypothetical protein [Myxococcota bacterium]
MGMNKPAILSTILCLFTAVWLLSLSAQASKKKDTAGSATDCVKWTTEARFVGVAYDHLVHLHSQCEWVAVCQVSTDVNPEGLSVALAPKEKKEVLTFRGSPARTFKAEVACQRKTGGKQ